ncbi:MAG: DUF1549 domain-containing protein [Planctomycetales bacterium]|nr:DUF1549 domain-containing protein [Planctomycetales bacterium]
MQWSPRVAAMCLKTAICAVLLALPTRTMAEPASSGPSNVADISSALVPQINQLTADIQVGPTARRCSDEDFLRRVYLDFWGYPPSPEQARDFLNDASPDKRDLLIDHLTNDPRFARHMTYVFDVWLMERRTDKPKGVSRADWHEYLDQSFANHKPFDQLVREIITADGDDGTNRVRAKFLLDRDCDPNGLVRDVSRLFLGRDVQCAQCHDHPLVNGYSQREYHGLLALLQRTHVFTDKKKDDTLRVGENPDGFAEYQSVFGTDDGKQYGLPRVAGSVPVDISFAAVDQLYARAPADDVRPIPEISMRAELATTITVDNHQFDRALANRLWSHLLGRGLVEPVDMHHADNPPAHHALLELLAQALPQLDYDVAATLSVLAKTDAYQRSIDRPNLDEIIAARLSIEETLAECTATIAELNTDLERQDDQVSAAVDRRNTVESGVQTVLRAIMESRTSLQKSLDEHTKAKAERVQVATRRAAAVEIAALLQTAAAKTQAAFELAPSDVQLKAAAESAATQHAARQKAADDLIQSQTTLDDKLAQLTQTRDELRASLHESEVRLAEGNQELKRAYADWLRLRDERDAAQGGLHLATRRSELAHKLLDLAAFSREPGPPVDESDTPDRDQLLQAIDPLWTELLTIAAPRPLSPEQLAWSYWETTGQIVFEQSAADGQWQQEHPAPRNLDATSAQERESLRAREVRTALTQRMNGTVNQFAALFGGGAGQVQTDFHATADQALFLANGGPIHNLLAPRGENLTARLLKCDSPDDLADELYISVLTRHASTDEAQAVREYLNQHANQKDAAVRQLTWSVLTSAEFRFFR